MIIVAILALLIVLQALLTAINVIARLLWGILGIALLYLMLVQFPGR